MIFRDWEAVRDGRKTQTRRVKGKGESLVMRDGARAVLTPSGRVKWHVGRTYAVQPGMAELAEGRFELLGIREGNIQDISEGDVRAEGLVYPDEFERLWDDIWKRRPHFQWAANPSVWVLYIRWVG